MKIKKLNTFIFLIVIFFQSELYSNEINIYSHRQPFLINPFLEAFTLETGIKTNVVYSKTGLAQRLESEGENSPADVILTVDIGRIYIIYGPPEHIEIFFDEQLGFNFQRWHMTFSFR